MLCRYTSSYFSKSHDFLNKQSKNARKIALLFSAGAVLSFVPMLAAETSSFAQQAQSNTVTVPNAYHLGPQDSIRLHIVAWRASRDEIFEWRPIEGEYTIDAAGFVDLPLIGQVEATNVTTNELSGRIAASLQQRISLAEKPDVAVQIVRYRPFYVVGDVSNPGEYAYRPGLNMIQVLAIAGGKFRGTTQERVTVEHNYATAVGDIRSMSSEHISLLARVARLQSELDDTDQIDFSSLTSNVEIVPEITDAMNHEIEVRKLRQEAIDTRSKALTSLKPSFVEEINAIETRLDGQAKHVAMEKSNVDLLGESFVNKVVSKTRWIESYRLLDQAEAERARLISELATARRGLGQTESSIAELHSRFREEVVRDLVAAKDRLTEVEHRLQTARDIKMRAERMNPSVAGDRIHFSVIRAGQTTTMAADETMSVYPGDTVKIEFNESDGAKPKNDKIGDPAGPVADKELNPDAFRFDRSRG